MKTEEKLVALHSKLNLIGTQGFGKNNSRELDVDEVQEAIVEAIESIHELKVVLDRIKAVVSGVKWYEFLKISAIVGDIIRIIKEYEWKS